MLVLLKVSQLVVVESRQNDVLGPVIHICVFEAFKPTDNALEIFT